MSAIFVDTGWFIAFLHSRDRYHARAKELRRATRGEFVTTWWVVVELFDGLSRSHQRAAATEAAERLLESSVRIVALDESHVLGGLALYRERSDKQWSLTDCISFVLMSALGLREALTADHHFTQAGFTALMA